MLRSLLGLGFAVAALAGGAPTSASDPIVGLWSYRGGTLTVAAADGGFTGTVVKPLAFSASCTHPAGERMWTITPGADGYAGTHRFLKADSACSLGGVGKATWAIDATDPNLLHFCATDPASGASNCSALTRTPLGSLAGYWFYSGGVVHVIGNLPRLLGTIVVRTRFAVCPHARGEVVWEVTGGGSGLYTGTNLGFAPKSCTAREKHRADFVPLETKLYVRIARRPGVDPGVCGPTTDCYALRRAGT